MAFRHWKIDRDGKSVAILAMDHGERSVNLLTREALAELDRAIGELGGDSALTGLILASAKPGGFVYGADIREFEELEDEDAVGRLLEETHATFNRLASLPVPTVAAIDGYALGGGLELALACDRLVATAGPKTRLGFPEVKLGLLPGYGGSGRAWARVGSAAALDMMLTGRMVPATEAAEMGLVDRLADGADTLPGGARAELDAMDGTKPPPAARREKDAAKAAEAARQKHLAGLRPDHTPAPFAIVDHVERHSGDAAAMSAGEMDIFPALMRSPASDGLRRLFHLQDMVRKDGRGDAGVKSLHVIGAGVMGGDIAAVAAMGGIKTTLSDMSGEAVGKAVDRARTLFERRLKTPERIKPAMGNLVADPGAEGLAGADLVIEAVAEDPGIKKKVFADIESKARTDAILATNTSSIPLEEIADVLKNPSRLIGLHFFNPATVLPLVEVVWSQQSGQELVARGMRFAGALGKMPIRCKSAPGFLVNRALLPYILKGIEAMLDGGEADRIDEALVDFGMPMGPVELADQIGLDVTHDASVPLGMPKKVAAALKEKVKDGKLGRKTGSGFYEWEEKRAVRPRAEYDAGTLEAMARDLLAPMVGECAKAVDEGIVDSAEHADAGMIFGVGFPGFRGGPLHSRERGVL